MTPSQAAQNLREWAKQMAEAEDWYLPAYRGRSLYSVLSEKLGIPDNAAVLALNDYSMSHFSMGASTLPHFILWLCFLADVIETDGTDWIQNV